jgi:hypothetical protein
MAALFAPFSSFNPVRASLVPFMLGCVTVVPRTSDAGEPVVAVGEVRGKTPAGEFSAPFKSLLAEAIARAELGSPRERFVLSATLVRLDAEQIGNGARASAAVSLVLRRAQEQTLYAVLSGRATAETTDTSLSETREDALRAAVRSAISRLPEALR